MGASRCGRRILPLPTLGLLALLLAASASAFDPLTDCPTDTQYINSTETVTLVPNTTYYFVPERTYPLANTAFLSDGDTLCIKSLSGQPESFALTGQAVAPTRATQTTGPLFQVAAGATLYLSDVIVDGTDGPSGQPLHQGADVEGTLITQRVLFINCKATSGGAIYIKGSLNLTDTRFVQNNADNGGAICLDSDSNSLSLTQVMMEQNSAKYGGGIFMAGGHPSSVLNIDGGSFTNMQAAEFGGAIYADKSDSGSINVVGATFSRNSASCGGAVSTSAARATFTGSTFDANKATTGGALCTLFSNVEVVVTGCSFTDNTAHESGGAVRLSGTATFTDCSLKNNKALNRGGAIGMGFGALTLTKVVFKYNQANYGGAIATSGKLTMTEVAFTRNTAVTGGALVVEYAYKPGPPFELITNTTITNTSFTDNAAEDAGGAIRTASPLNTYGMVSFTRNTAGFGGAIVASGVDPALVKPPVPALLTLNGFTSFTDNTCTNAGCGAALNLGRGAQTVVLGKLCGQGNKGSAAGFALVDSSLDGEGDSTSLVFASPDVNLANNLPYAVSVANDSRVACINADGKVANWMVPGNYSITGPACACASAFASGASSSCNSCKAFGCESGWLPDLCACKECPVGSCSCNDGSILPNTTVCRSARGPCESDSLCNGVNATCPDNYRPQSSKCRAEGPCVLSKTGQCDGKGFLCHTLKVKPDGNKCLISKPSKPYGLKSSDLPNAQAAGAKFVTATDADARLAAAKAANATQYTQWPICTGTCAAGHCSVSRVEDVRSAGCCRVGGPYVKGSDAAATVDADAAEYVCWP